MKRVALIVRGDERMDLYADGTIGRANWPVSRAWVCTGAVRLHDSGAVVACYDLDEVIRGRVQWKDPDGRQRVFLTDLDHGVERVWLMPCHEVRPVEEAGPT
jgi:hypothetical protein